MASLGSLSLKTKFGLTFAALALITAAVMTLALYLKARDNLRQDLREGLRHLVEISALLVDADAHATLISTADENGATYKRIQSDLQRIRSTGEDIRWVYTLRQGADGQVVFVITLPPDPMQPHLGDVYEEPGLTLAENFATLRQSIVEDDFNTDKWGTWLTGYAPLITSAGTLDGVLAMDISADKVVAHEREFLWVAMTVFAVIVPFAIALGWIVGRKLAAPIFLLTIGAERIAGGDLKSKVSVGGDGEIAELARAFNSMASQLNNSLDNLREEVATRRLAEKEVRELNLALEDRVIERTRRLEATNRELEAFTYSVSHDLRAPLRAINGFTEALLEDYGGLLDEEGKAYLYYLKDGSRDMKVLIEGLLKLSRSTRGELVRESVDLSALINSVVKELRQAEAERQVTVDVTPNIEVDADPALLKVVMENLLGNAWKYTEQTADATIAFVVEVQEGKSVYVVRDNGAGFDMAYVDKLFLPFQRLHKADEFSGAGIGLATVQRIIHRHGGRIWAQGVVGEGAIFYFTLGEDGRADEETDSPPCGRQPSG